MTRDLINEARKILTEAPGKFYQFEWVSGIKTGGKFRHDNISDFDGYSVLVEVQSTNEAAARKEAIAFYKAHLNKVLKSGKKMNNVITAPLAK